MTNARDKANIPVLNFQSKGIDDNATSTALTINSNETVEITSSEQELLYLNSSHATNSSIKLQGGYHSNLFSKITESAGAFVMDVDPNGQEAGSNFRVKIGGSEKARLTSTGLGIGTSSMDGILHLDDGTSTKLIIEKDGGGHASVTFHNDGASTSYIQLDASEDMVHYGGSGVNQIFYASGSERMRVTSSGLGVGTSAPSTSIHIKSNTPILTFEETDQSNRQFQIGSFGNAYAINDATNSQFRYILDNSGNHVFNEGGADCDFRVESNNNANMLFVDGGQDRIGIGESAPLGKFHITSLGSGATVSGDADELIIENGTSGAATGISILSATNGYGNIMFGDSGDNNIGVFQYDHNSNFMRFIVNASERVRFDASGDMLLGKTSISTNAVGVAITGSGLGAFTRSGDAPILANRTSSDGNIALFRKNNSTVGTIGNSSADFFITNSTATNGAGILLQNNLFVNPMKGGSADTSSSISLGNSSRKWKDLYLGGGVFLGGTGTDNKLDDYEEGLHTASITDSGGTATITMNSSFNQLSYTKIGRLVHVQGTLLVASISATISGTVRISLPFAASSLADQAGKGRIGIGTHNVNFTSSGTAPFLHVGENDAYGQIVVTNDNLNASQAQFGDTSAQFYIGGTYITDA